MNCFLFWALSSAKSIMPKSLVYTSEEDVTKTVVKKKSKVKTNNFNEKTTKDSDSLLHSLNRPIIRNINENSAELNQNKIQNFEKSSSLIKETTFDETEETLNIGSTINTEFIPTVDATSIEEQSQINSTRVPESFKDESISIYNDFVNSEYYIYILSVIILVCAIIITFIFSKCCICLQRFCTNREEEQQLTGTTSESESGFVPL